MTTEESGSELYKALQNVTYNGEWQSDLRKAGLCCSICNIWGIKQK